MIVYTLLDKSRVDEISNVTLRLDSRDIDGIDNIIATISKIHGDDSTSFTIPLRLVSGKNTYGTWEGTFEVNQGDTTYKVITITLSNSNDTRTELISDRSVYASKNLPMPVDNTNFNSFVTGNVIGKSFSNIANGPFMLTLLSLFVVVFISAFFLVQRHIRSRRQSQVN